MVTHDLRDRLWLSCFSLRARQMDPTATSVLPLRGAAPWTAIHIRRPFYGRTTTLWMRPTAEKFMINGGCVFQVGPKRSGHLFFRLNLKKKTIITGNWGKTKLPLSLFLLKLLFPEVNNTGPGFERHSLTVNIWTSLKTWSGFIYLLSHLLCLYHHFAVIWCSINRCSLTSNVSRDTTTQI